MMMDAVMLRRFGGPEVLEFETIDRPDPAPGEVLVRIEAVSVNRTFDIAAREGKSQFPVKLPAILGVDPTGTIVDAADDADRARIGDAVHVSAISRCGVCANCRAGIACSAAKRIGIDAPGGYAQYICVPAFQARTIPAGIDPGEATVIGRHGEAAWSELESSALAAGEVALVMGAAGALGSLLIQLAKLRGATVIAVASSAERRRFCTDLGADHAIDYRAGDLTEQALALTGGKGVNVVFENVSDPATFPQALASLGRGGRLVSIGYHGGGTVPLDMRRVFMNQLIIRSSPMWQPGQEGFARCFALAAEGRLKGPVGCRKPLAEADEGHRVAEAGSVCGKVILQPNSPAKRSTTRL